MSGGQRWSEPTLFPDIKREWYRGKLVGSVITGTNADLIAEIGPVHLSDGPVLDVTYGRGAWWKRWTPPHGLTWHSTDDDTAADFTDLPHPDRSWHTVVYDPPYIPAGGTTTSTVGDFQSRYGVDGGRSQASLAELIMAGLHEVCRVAADRVLLKCQDYVSGGRFTPMSYLIAGALPEGWALDDEIIHHAGAGPGGHNISRQIRSRSEHSKLLVLKRQ